jgi:transposase-like protein
MPNKITTKLRDQILALSADPKLTKAEIGRRLDLPRETVRDALRRLSGEKKSWQGSQEKSDSPGAPPATDLPDPTALKST